MNGFTWEPSELRIAAAMMPDGATDPDRVARAYAAAVWSCLIEPGDCVAGALIEALGPDRALREVLGPHPAHLAQTAEVTPAELHAGLARWQPRLDTQAIAFAMSTAGRSGVRLLTPDDPGWPAALADLGRHAPVCLWVRGEPGVLARLDPAVAIVGARASSAYGEHIAAELAADLAGRGAAVISGAAYGIDGAAHRAALAVGGTTVALVAGGVDRAYPAGHADLLRRIVATGAVVGETPCGTAPTRWRFLQRNRNIAALAGATVVVEAGWRSGSLNTAGHAAALGRPLGAVPGPVTSGSSAGCHRLLREYDARCITSGDDLAELVGMAPTAVQEPNSGSRVDERTRILDALSARTWRDVDEIARRSGMSPVEVSSHLGLMELEETVHSRGGDWRRAAMAQQE